MLDKKSVVSEAIADAKEFKKMAIENARMSLAESVTPAIAALLSKKLTEDLNQEEEEGAKPPVADEAFNALMEKLKEEDPEKYEAVSKALDEKKAPEKPAEEEEEGAKAEEPEEESLDIEAALAEIENGQIAETDDKDADDKPAEEEEEEEEEEVKDAEDQAEEPSDDDIDEDYISRIMAEVEEGDAEPDADADDKPAEESPMDENLVTDAAKKLKDFIAANLKGLTPADMKKAIEQGAGYTTLPSNLEAKEEKPAEEEEEEGVKAEELLELKRELFEINLLSGKLIFQNKLLLSENFSDEQKARIIKAFDKAKTINEAKVIYETLKVNAKPKSTSKPLSESLGFKRIGAPAPGKVEKISYDVNDPIVQDMQRRAGIKKH